METPPDNNRETAERMLSALSTVPLSVPNVVSPVYGTVVCPDCCQPCLRYRCLLRMLSALSTVPLSAPNVVSPVHGTAVCPECFQPCPRHRCLSISKSPVIVWAVMLVTMRHAPSLTLTTQYCLTGDRQNKVQGSSDCRPSPPQTQSHFLKCYNSSVCAHSISVCAHSISVCAHSVHFHTIRYIKYMSKTE